MKNNIIKTGIIAAFAMATIFTACQKMDEETKKSVVETIVHNYDQNYENDTALNLALHKVLALSSKERKAQEVAQGFKSFATICQEFYETIDPNQFQSIEEIKAFVAEHSEYIQLIEDENGEYTVETVAYANPYRYLANESGEIKVGGNICKITDDAVLNIKNQSEVALSPMKRAKRQEVGPQMRVPSAAPLLNTVFYKEEKSGNNKIQLEFQTFLNPNYEYPVLVTWYWIKPYHRVIAWFGCQRSLFIEFAYEGRLEFLIQPIGGKYYPLSWEYYRADDGSEMFGNILNYVTTDKGDPRVYESSYKFKGWSGSGISWEWVYQP
ncbi:MAG: hypothetical protein LBU91_00255 [Bacteroidales bacterium]|jgi:hypothetical protein|nr:hypothetical protein [Bacteroidales bacterium]